jgi:hypothetical protein
MPPTKRGAHVRASRLSIARSIASTALPTGTGLRMNAGMLPCSVRVDGCAKDARTRSVSMKPKYAQPARAPVVDSSTRSASVSASTPAFEAVYGPISGAWLAAASDATFSR